MGLRLGLINSRELSIGKKWFRCKKSNYKITKTVNSRPQPHQSGIYRLSILSRPWFFNLVS